MTYNLGAQELSFYVEFTKREGNCKKSSFSKAVSTQTHAEQIRAYVLYFDSASEKAAHFAFQNVTWAHIIPAVRNPFFETMAFVTVLKDLNASWLDKKFVGLLSYKSVDKIMSKIPLKNVIEELTAQEDADVIALLAPRGLTLRDQAQKTHGLYFIEVWHEVLRRLDFNESTIRASDDVEMFFCNYWLAKPTVVLQYIAFLERAIWLMQHDVVLSFLLESDARYAEGKNDVSQSVFGSPFYKLHPFIGERLSVFFFWWQNACVVRVRTTFQPRTT